MVKLADDYFDSMDPNDPPHKPRSYKFGEESPRKEDNVYYGGDELPIESSSHPVPLEMTDRRLSCFQSSAFLLEENAPTVVAGKSVFVQRFTNKAHFKLRQTTLGLTLKQASQALRISLTQANDLEQGRLRCDWKLAARILKRAAERA